MTVCFVYRDAARITVWVGRRRRKTQTRRTTSRAKRFQSDCAYAVRPRARPRGRAGDQRAGRVRIRGGGAGECSSTAVSLPITKYPITTRLTTDHRPRYRYRRDSRRCKPRGSTCKPRGTPAGSTSAVSPTPRTNQSSENSWATRWRRCVHLNLFLVIFGYFWLFLVIFVRSIRLNHSMCVLSLTGWRNVAGVRSGE